MEKQRKPLTHSTHTDTAIMEPYEKYDDNYVVLGACADCTYVIDCRDCYKTAKHKGGDQR
jgi:hypothetical protein